VRAAAAGSAYFALVFTAGVGLGVVRAFAVAPCLGATAAVLIELPAMLVISWLVCGWSIRLFRVPEGFRTRLAMGALAFLMLIAAELLLSLGLGNGSVGTFLAVYQTPAGLIGLAGQLAFALFPLAPRLPSRKAP
jgi:hypothetical protein